VFINIDGFNEVALYPTVGAPQGTFAPFPLYWRLKAQHAIDLPREILIGEAAYTRSVRQHWADAVGEGPWRYSVTAELAWWLRDERLTAAIVEANQAVHRYEEWERVRGDGAEPSVP
jgi:hypothetical protein